MNIDYDLIQQTINSYSKYIIENIKKEYYNSLSHEQLEKIQWLLNEKNFVMIDKPCKEDLEFFSKQEGIINPNNYSYDFVPSDHGERTKNDNKIHIYPYAKSYENCKTNEEIIKTCVEDITIHEIFHYFIQPNIQNSNDLNKEEFGHFLTEGLVQHYTEDFAKKFNLANPHSNYEKNVNLAKTLIEGFPKDIDINKAIFNLNQDQLLSLSANGKNLYKQFVNEKEFYKKLPILL